MIINKKRRNRLLPIMGVLIFLSAFFYVQETKENVANESETEIEKAVMSNLENDDLKKEMYEDISEIGQGIEFPKSYKNIVNNVLFDLNVEVSEKADLENLVQYYAKRQYPDSEAVRTVFTPKKTIQEENKSIGTGEDGGKFENVYRKFEDGSSLATGNTFLYATPFNEDVHNAFRFTETFLCNADRYSQDEVFAFASPDEAFQEITEKINASGYTLGEMEYVYYALDAVTMEKEEVEYSKSGEMIEGAGREWTEEDNSYYIFAEQMLGGLPVYCGYQDFPEDSLENKPIQALYSSRGIERLDVFQIYTFTGTEEKLYLSEFDKAIECVAYKYGNILTDAEYVVTRAKLYWKPIKAASGNYYLRPVWLFEVHETGNDSETGENFENVIYTFVDAVTGEEVSS